MITVLKNNMKTYEATCSRCGSEFTYQDVDVDCNGNFVICPICHCGNLHAFSTVCPPHEKPEYNIGETVYYDCGADPDPIAVEILDYLPQHNVFGECYKIKDDHLNIFLAQPHHLSRTLTFDKQMENSIRYRKGSKDQSAT